MPRFIVKLKDEDKDYYMEWSTVVDAPVTFGLSLEEFKEHYKEEYGNRGLMELDERLKRVEEKGISSLMDEDIHDIISGNRAGKDETELSLEQIIEGYCRNREEDKIPVGKEHNWEED